MDDVKDGKLVGTDKYGNKYYQNPRYFYGRNRWVEYAPQYGNNTDKYQLYCMRYKCKCFRYGL